MDVSTAATCQRGELSVFRSVSFGQTCAVNTFFVVVEGGLFRRDRFVLIKNQQMRSVNSRVNSKLGLISSLTVIFHFCAWIDVDSLVR